ncbi:dynamin [Phialemonium atrogriseum]|uniref:Dynamin n=1 Tax=Phialemonium atrogriseum TaxID=1093897 RepID=A0AAJ0FLI7_9PEZI|nr:dynamin [Phialemonium atrogriseum]KAK1772242.1 dynamin [Phialemonium atrogriseum]
MTVSASSTGISPAVPIHGLHSAKSTRRLNQIDKIRANGVGEHVSLPQLVVCGDQSAGKSSVLERVTSVPFPRQDGLCTRFPTEIILRHNTEPLRISASIQPSARRPPETRETLRRYRRNLSDDMSELPEVISESAALMGIRGYGSTQSGNTFAQDVLRIEIVGPTNLHLTIVDLPGLISVPNEDQTDADIRIVRELVKTYLSSTRTIIMAVLQASNDIANQGILQLVRQHDPDGQRTVGIITKPDLITKGVEGRIAMLAKSLDSVKLKLGFFLMKNASPAEAKEGLTWDDLARREEKFFSTPAWKEHNLGMRRVGVEPLRLFLQDLLSRHIEKELPKVREEIKHRLAVTEAELALMGAERPTVGHIRYFLTGLSMQFHQLAQAALDGNYQGPDMEFFKIPETRLRADVHKVNGNFANHMRDNGKKRKVSAQPDSENSESEPDDDDEDEARQIRVSEEELNAWVREVYERTRGRELPGNYNHALLAELFHEQSSLWPRIARDHLANVVLMVSNWVEKAINASVREEAVHQEITMICQRNLSESERLANEELDKLIADEKYHPITYNHSYTDNIQKARRKEQDAAMAKARSTLKTDWFGNQDGCCNAGDIEKLLQAIRSNTIIKMDDQACSEALAGMNAYYKVVAMKTFVDNVCRQVIERHVLSRLPTLFCPKTASGFSDEELLRIGSEPENHRARRAELDSLVKALQQSLDDLQSS